jgi:endonuclease-8
MPEGDTIWRTAAMLRDALAGKRITQARPESLRRLISATVMAVEPTGKHLVVRFDNGYALHSHMRMRGVWHVYKPGERWQRPAFRLKALLETDSAVAVCFDAPIVELIRNVNERVGHLGPDILAEDWQPGEVLRRARQLNDLAVAELLLDQRVTAGIGNVYRCEALWQQRISPFKKTQEMSDTQLTDLFEAARKAMRANLTTGTWRRSFPGHGPAAVHGRAGRPCPRCLTPIRSKGMGENPRTVYWCDRCQT